MNLIVIPCRNHKGNYYTIYNSDNGFHCHAKKNGDCVRILRVAQQIEDGAAVRESYDIRRKAMRLFIAGKRL